MNTATHHSHRGLGQDGSQAAMWNSTTGSANTPIFSTADITQLGLAYYAPWLIGGVILVFLLSTR